MDSNTQRIIERARQRQELLAQKLGETPEAVPRKRRTPLVDDDSQNVPPPNIADDDSPKRHCSREKLQEVKPDTPAISSVRSRLNALASQRSQWSATDSGEESENSGPPPRQRYEPSEDDLPRDPPSRKSRLANLAQTINCWEDDLSHPTIQKEEPQKARWRPPKPAEPEKPAEPTSSRQRDRIFSGGHNKGKAPSPPTETTNPSSERSTKYHAPPPPAPPLPDKLGKSPKKLSPPKPALNRMVSPAKPLRCEIRVNLNQEPINIQEVRDSGEETDEPTKKPVTARMAKWAEKTASTPTKATDPTQQPLSARFAKWEERTQTPTKPPVPKPMLLNTPKQTFPVQKFNSASKATAAPSPATKFNPPKLCSSETKVKVNKPRDSEDPASKPVSERMAKWQQKVEGDKPDPKDDEPTAYSVTARMSAWEHMSSSNQVSYVKKVEPGTSPAKAPASTPPCSPAAKTPRSGSKKSEAKTTPSGKKNLKPQKSFVESIMEKASEIRSPYKGTEEVHEGRAVNPVEKPPRARNPSSQSPGKTKTTPSKRDTHAEKGASPDDALSPTHASAAMKSIHQRLMEQTSQSTTSQTMAERLRQERMQELASIQNRWQNGILREDSASDSDHQPQYQQQQSQETSSDHSPPKMQRLSDVISSKEEKKEQIRAKAREDFEGKLASLGFEKSSSSPGVASVSFRKSRRNAFVDSASSQEDEPVNQSEQRYRRPSSKKPTPPAPPQMKFAVATPTSEKRGNQQKQPVSSLLQLVRKGSQVKSAVAVNRQTFDDGFDSDGSESTASSRRKSQCSVDSDIVDTQDETEPTESQDSLEEDSSFEKFKGNIEDEPVDEGDDVSLSAFVPASVRRQSVLPTNDRHSLTSQSSSEDVQRLKSLPSKSPKATKSPKTTKTDSDHYVFHSSTFDVKSMMQRNEYGQSSASLNSTASTASEVSIGETYEERRKYYESEETETDADEEGRDDVGDYLDEALDEKPPVAAPRKRRSHMMATQSSEGDCPLMYSVSMYRSKKRFDTRPPPKMVIKRNREVTEDELEMPPLPRQAPARSLEERIRELTELGNQELSVIKQASNALNQCCLGNSTFAGSAEQAECNRLLLISSQRRMAYMSEIQRLRDERTLEEDTSGPKGSLTISEMRLPLKREFVTKLGTAADSAVHYFIILIRNGSHIIVTEMLSTHDERMRGSLDFPNHINVNNITGSFQVQLEIYGMSIVREVNSKDKKKNKTPKKNKKDLRILQSPGGPNAVMTSSFKLIATLPITMKSVDKACFNLEKVPYVSPVYGTIYMRLKCTKEASVVERGFLTLFEDVSGLGAWHRRWCLLSSNKICFWKYPDEETKKEPLGYIDLKRCITEKVGLLPRDICARKDTFELVTVRQPRKGEQDTLVSKTYSTMTTVKHMLSADTKEERILWCNKINRALINIRTWHPEAARPIKGTVKH